MIKLALVVDGHVVAFHVDGGENATEFAAGTKMSTHAAAQTKVDELNAAGGLPLDGEWRVQERDDNA